LKATIAQQQHTLAAVESTVADDDVKQDPSTLVITLNDVEGDRQVTFAVKKVRRWFMLVLCYVIFFFCFVLVCCCFV
jgi:hypothetical protein